MCDRLAYTLGSMGSCHVVGSSCGYHGAFFPSSVLGRYGSRPASILKGTDSADQSKLPAPISLARSRFCFARSTVGIDTVLSKSAARDRMCPASTVIVSFRAAWVDLGTR
jgi:hypothetical protein